MHTQILVECKLSIISLNFVYLISVLAVEDRHVAFSEYNGSVARIICVAVATPTSLAKGYDLGPPSLHPWRI